MIMCSFFFFKQKTAYEISVRDWSSDVCSSDLTAGLFILEFSKKRLIESVCLNFRQVLMSDSHLDEQFRFIFYVEQTVVEPLHGNPNEPTGPGGSLDCRGSALE